MQQIRWLRDLIPVETLGEPLNIAKSIEVVEKPSAQLCLLCRGSRLLCGKSRCPVLMRATALVRHSSSIDSEVIQGATPPGVFVGRFGYPQVYVGPMVPPYHGDTSILDTPELWLGKSLDEIVDYRFSLVRGSMRANIFDVQKGSRLISSLQELAMASKPIESELQLNKRPRMVLTVSEHAQPFGPSAPLRALKSSNPSVDRRIEYAHYDKDLKASEAVVELYRRGVLITRIQRAFSIGMFGLDRNRRMVPTRWSITAVDSAVSSQLIDKIKQYPSIDEFRVYNFRNLDNIYLGILMPEPWKFEWIEAWFPKTTWNPYGSSPELMGDYEEYWGRTTYASIGGCYYSTRLAVAEALSRERRQAGAIFLREIHPGYILPVGVWNVRESIRAVFKTKPLLFDNIQDALKQVSKRFTIPLKRWISTSVLLRRALFQKKISDYTSES